MIGELWVHKAANDLLNIDNNLASAVRSPI